ARAVRGHVSADAGRPDTPGARGARPGSPPRPLPLRRGPGPAGVPPGPHLAGDGSDHQLDAGRALSVGGRRGDAPRGRERPRGGRGRPREGLQRAGVGPLPCPRGPRDAHRRRVPAQGSLEPQHRQRDDRQRGGAGYADRSRGRRLLQRRPRRSRAVRRGVTGTAAFAAERAANKSRLRAALLLTVGVLLVEVAGGIVTHSLALVADAAHMFADVAALTLAWAGIALGERAPTGRHTFGLARAEVLAAFVNAQMLLVASVLIVWEAW